MRPNKGAKRPIVTEQSLGQSLISLPCGNAMPSRIVDAPLTCPIKNEISATDRIIYES
jgi:hypothetical protein